MDSREILIANSKTQRRHKIVTAATTLGELKAAMRDNDIDYDGLSFTEGITKTQLLDDASLLPANVPYKGGTTNQLVILLTNTKKNIASGCDDAVTLTNRSEAYRIIKEKGLQEEIKTIFGRNFTQVPTVALWDFINSNEDKEDLFDENAEKSEMNNNFNDGIAEIVEAVVDMVGTMVEDGYLDADDLEDMLEMLEEMRDDIKVPETPKANPVATTDGVITNDDVDKMLADLS